VSVWLGPFAVDLERPDAKFAPYLAGDSLTLADIVFFFSVDIAAAVGKQVFGLDLLADLPGAQALIARLSERPHARTIAANRDAGMPAFIAAMRARLQGAG
jgi:glutathione S-transferase